jgi:hypothetical protein
LETTERKVRVCGGGKVMEMGGWAGEEENSRRTAIKYRI